MTDTPTEKTCTECKKTKPLEEYKKHKAGRFGRGSKCKDCERERQRAWRARNPDYMRSYMKGWRARNPDYRKEHAHFSWKGSYKERTARLGLEPVIEDFTKADVIEEYGDRCWHCKDAPFEELDHHPVPVRLGGHHKLSNVKPSCMKCNDRGRPPKSERRPRQDHAAA